MNSHLKKYLKLLLKLAISIGALYFVYTKIDVKAIGLLLKTSNIIYLFIALLFFVISKTVAAYRLNRFFMSIQIFISAGFNLRLYLLGMFYNLFLPGGIGGDGYKIYLLDKKFDIKLKKIFWAVLIDRISGVSGLFTLSVILFYFIDKPWNYNYYVWLLIPLMLIVFYQVIRYFFKDLRKVFFITFFQSLMVQLLQLISAFFILLGLGINVQQIGYLFIFLVSSIVAALTPSIGGAGTRELTFYFGSQFINLNTDSSIALSVLFYIITVVVSFFGIYYSINQKKLN